MKRIHFRYLLWLSALLLIVWIVSLTLYYDRGVLAVGKTIIRAVALQAIEASVLVYDPSPPSVRARLSYSSEQSLDISEDYGSSERLLELLSSLNESASVQVQHFYNTPFIQSPFDFGYQPYADEKLAELRKKYGLSRLLVSSRDDFLDLVAITNWVNSQWEHGTSGADAFDPVSFNADTILKRARTGGQFWCHPTAMTLIQLAAALGYQGRLGIFN